MLVATFFPPKSQNDIFANGIGHSFITEVSIIPSLTPLALSLVANVL